MCVCVCVVVGGGVELNIMNKCFKGTSFLQGERLCQIILKYMHKYGKYGPDKLNL